MLPRHAGCVISRLRCNGDGLVLGFFLSRIGRIEILPAAPVDTSHLILHCPATDSLRRSLFYQRPLVQTLGSCPASVAPWSSAMPPEVVG